MTLRDRLDRYRSRRGLTPAQLAERWGMPLKTLRGWEGGKGEAKIGRVVGALLDELDG